LSDIDFSLVGEVQQDFTRLTVKILSKEGYVLWESRYQKEESFNTVFRRLNKRFLKEIERRNHEKKL